VAQLVVGPQESSALQTGGPTQPSLAGASWCLLTSLSAGDKHRVRGGPGSEQEARGSLGRATDAQVPTALT
jgi:hypothetical protein